MGALCSTEKEPEQPDNHNTYSQNVTASPSSTPDGWVQLEGKVPNPNWKGNEALAVPSHDEAVDNAVKIARTYLGLQLVA